MEGDHDRSDIVAQVAPLVGDLEECLCHPAGKRRAGMGAATNSAPISTARNSIVNATPTKAAAIDPRGKNKGTTGGQLNSRTTIPGSENI